MCARVMSAFWQNQQNLCADYCCRISTETNIHCCLEDRESTEKHECNVMYFAIYNCCAKLWKSSGMVIYYSWEMKVKTNHSHGEHIQCFSRRSDDFKVVLEDGDGAAQSLMATPTEQGHTHVEENSGDQGCPGQTAHTSLTALLTTCTNTHKKTNCVFNNSASWPSSRTMFKCTFQMTQKANGEKQVCTRW